MKTLLLKSTELSLNEQKNDKFVKELSSFDIDCEIVKTLNFLHYSIEFDPGNVTGVIFTSQQSVKAFEYAGIKISSSLLCFVVGPATGNSAKKLGFEPLGIECGNADALSDFIIQYFSGKNAKLTFFAGEKHREVLADILPQHGIEVNTKVVYKAVPNEESVEIVKSKIKELGNLCLVFFSASIVDLMISVLREYRNCLKLISIGPTTSKSLENVGLSVDGVCRDPTPSALVDCLLNSRINSE